ncbi:MAG: ATP synthase F0 subunit B [Mariprofundales bacterium]
MLIATAMAVTEKGGIPQFQTEHYSSQLFWAALSFLLLLYLLQRFVLPVIKKTLDERAATISQQLEQAANSKKEAEALLLDYQRLKSKIEEEYRQMLLEAAKEIAIMRDMKVEEIRQYQERCKQELVEDIRYAKNQASKEISNIAIDLAITATEELIKQRPVRSDVADIINQITQSK